MNKISFRIGFVALAVVIMALLAPVIWAAASAGAGILVLGVLGAVGMGALQMIPYMGQKLENMVLKLRKNEARVNPIEQLQNFLRQKAQRVAEFKNAVSSIGAQVKSLEDMIAQRKRENPKYDSTAREESIAEMKRAHAAMKQKYINAEQALKDLKVVIDDKKVDWEFSKAGQAAMAAINATSGQELMEAMLADEAFSSVTDNFNKVFAELEMEAAHLSSTQQLTFDQGMSLDLTQINLTEKVSA